MGIEKKEEIKVIKSKDTGAISVKTIITTTDTRPTTTNFTYEDSIRGKDNRFTLELAKSLAYFGGTVSGAIGGISLIITGIENLNAEQIVTGAGAVLLAGYFFQSTRKHLYEAGLAKKEINKIKNLR